jgi:hypothetical protein
MEYHHRKALIAAEAPAAEEPAAEEPAGWDSLELNPAQWILVVNRIHLNRLNRLDHLDYQAFAFHSLQFQSCNGLAHLGLAIYVFAMNLPHKA